MVCSGGSVAKFFVSTETVLAINCCHDRIEAVEPVDMKRSPYDLIVLRERAELWRAEAAAAKFEAMRVFCLTEANQCEHRVHISLTTPVIREIMDNPGTPAGPG
jgi:hypothetical protein